jgi:predicted ferric reductase
VTPKVWWYVARSAGLGAWWLAGASLLLGLLLAGRLRRRPSAAWQLDLHRYLGALATACLGLHVAALTLDPTVAFPLDALTVPMASTWRPGAVAWGVVAAYLLVAVEITSLLRARIPRRVWHTVHLTSFVVWTAGSVHAWTAGSDQRIVRVAALAGSAAIANLTVWRVVGRRVPRARAPDRRAAATRTAVAHPSGGG